MRTLLVFLGISFLLLASCKKETSLASPVKENYSDIYDFISKNEVKSQTFSINGSTGGSFTTTQGTSVLIPANAFVTTANIPVAGIVTIEFKDLYKKSDILLSNIPTATYNGDLLKSGGEFYILARYNNTGVLLANGKKIEINLSVARTGKLDTAQSAYIGQFANFSGPTGWFAVGTDTASGSMADTLLCTALNYVFNLYQLDPNGSWGNSDDPSFFSAYPLSSLTLIPTDSIQSYGTNIYLVFKNITTVYHLYPNSSTFPFPNAPQGLQCTAVCIGFKNGSLYSAFVPITIGSNQTIPFTLSLTTTSTFTSQLQALN